MTCIHGRVDDLCQLCADGYGADVAGGAIPTVAIMAAILAHQVPVDWLDAKKCANQAWTLYRAVKDAQPD